MGFIFKTPKMPSVPQPAEVVSTPAVATETVQEDITRNYEQKRANKRGLLSTILNNHNKVGALSSPTGGNTTLG